MAFIASIDTGLAGYPGEIADKNLHKELVYIYRAFQNLQLGIDRIHRGLDTYIDTAAYGDLISISGAGAYKASAAVATSLQALGFCPTAAGVASGVIGEVQYLGIISGLTGIIPGTVYYLSATTAGSFTATAPIAPDLIQPIGFGISTTSIFFNPTLL